MSRMTGRDDRPARRVKLTYDDFVQFPEDGMRHELIDGEHVVTPSPNLRHQELLGRLHLRVGNWLEEHPVGRAFMAPLDVVFTRFDVVEPDLLYVSHERAAEWLNEKNATGVDLAVEIGSPSTRRRDETLKLRLYERTGVSEYWFVDPDADLVRVYRRQGERFAAPLEYSADRDDVLATPLLPEFHLSVRRLFRDA
jgi:Uma2 family endonuclease